MALISNPKPGDDVSVRQAIARLGSSKLGPTSTPTFAGLTLNGTLDMSDNPITDVGYIDFNLVNGVSPQEGRLYWNDDDGTLNLGLKGGNVNLQVGLEQVIRAKAGETISDGEAVTVTDALGVNTIVSLADADLLGVDSVVGVATEDIANGQFGYVTTFGLVRDIDTTGGGEGWSAGDFLYLSTTAGQLTNVVPSGSIRKVFVGVVATVHASNGVIWVSPSTIPFVDNLSGVDITSIADNDLLRYESSSSTWVNNSLTELESDLTQYSLVKGGANGVLSSLGVASNGQLPIGSTGVDPVLAALTGTANQVIVTNGAGSITLSTPQDIHTGATPQFARMGLGTAADGTAEIKIANGTLLGDSTLKIDSTNANVRLGTDTFSSDEGIRNVGIGYQAGLNNSTVGGASQGDNCVYIGYQSGAGLTAATNNTGYMNVGIGTSTLVKNTSGRWNMAIGGNAMVANTSGENNLAIGFGALQSNTTASANVAVGSASLANSNAGNCVAVGYNCLFSNSSGGPNIGIGRNAGYYNATGSSNTIIGYLSGFGVTGNNYSFNTFVGHVSGNAITTGSSNIFLGAYAGRRQTNLSSRFIVDSTSRADAATEITNSLLYGIMGANPVNQSLRINGEILGSYGAKIGDGGTTDYTEIETDGDILQRGAGRFIESSKFKLTPIGGFAILLTNTTGANTVAGQLVEADPATDDAVVLAAIGAVDCIGVFLDDGIADDAEAWVVVAGIADVAFDDNVAAVHGNWMATGVAAGYARTSASPAASPQHFEEIGHCIESVAATGGGTHILARCVLHFN